MGQFEKGDGGISGQSAYYTNEKTLEAAKGSATSLFESLQVKPHEVFGYRSEMAKYEVLSDLKIPVGEVKLGK